MRVSQEADDIYADFATRPGAQHIASANAINALMWILDRWHPRAVLEVGTGIGTLTHTLLRGSSQDVRVTCTEDHPFCVEQLALNLGPLMAQIDLYESYDEVPADRWFDLIIVDGGSAQRYVDRLVEVGVIWVEGDRAPQRSVIESSGREVARAQIRSVRRAQPGGPTVDGQVWEGGSTIYRFEPSMADRLRLLALHAWHGSRLVDARRRVH